MWEKRKISAKSVPPGPPDDLPLIDHLIFLKWFMSLRNNKLKLKRSYLFNIKLVKRSSRGGKTCEVTLYDHAYYRGNFQAKSVKPSQWNPIGTRCYIKFSSQEIVHHRTKEWFIHGPTVPRWNFKGHHLNIIVVRYDLNCVNQIDKVRVKMSVLNHSLSFSG